jgi:hypothetical protein
MKKIKGRIEAIQRRGEMAQVQERKHFYKENLQLKKENEDYKKQINEIHKMLKENIK